MGASGVYERLEAGEGEEDDYEDAIGSRAWALQELKPSMSSASGHASPHLEGAASSFERSESRERMPSRPVSRSDYRGRRQM